MIAILVDDRDKDYRVAIVDFRCYVCTNANCGKYLDKSPDRFECGSASSTTITSSSATANALNMVAK